LKKKEQCRSQGDHDFNPEERTKFKMQLLFLSFLLLIELSIGCDSNDYPGAALPRGFCARQWATSLSRPRGMVRLLMEIYWYLNLDQILLQHFGMLMEMECLILMKELLLQNIQDSIMG